MTSIVATSRSHLSALARIGKTQWPNEKWITPGYLRITLQKEGAHYTALSDGKVVGSIMVVEEDFPKYWIHYFIVDAKLRRQGIGAALLRKVEEKLPRNAFLFVDLEKNDEVGISFYRKNGFKRMGKVKNWFEGREGIILAKKI